MLFGREELERLKDKSLDSLVVLTQDFLKLADNLYANHKLTDREYYELTHSKKQFLDSII